MPLHGDPQGIREVIQRLGLSAPRPGSQDPEIECSDPGRVGDLLDLYEQPETSVALRDAAMWMVMGAYEEYHGDTPPPPEIWSRIARLLERDRDQHHDLIDYYGCADDPGEDVFPITPLMRQMLPKGGS